MIFLCGISSSSILTIGSQGAPLCFKVSAILYVKLLKIFFLPGILSKRVQTDRTFNFANERFYLRISGEERPCFPWFFFYVRLLRIPTFMRFLFLQAYVVAYLRFSVPESCQQFSSISSGEIKPTVEKRGFVLEKLSLPPPCNMFPRGNRSFLAPRPPSINSYFKAAAATSYIVASVFMARYFSSKRHTVKKWPTLTLFSEQNWAQ